MSNIPAKPELGQEEMLLLKVIDWAQKHGKPISGLTEHDILFALRSR